MPLPTGSAAEIAWPNPTLVVTTSWMPAGSPPSRAIANIISAHASSSVISGWRTSARRRNPTSPMRAASRMTSSSAGDLIRLDASHQQRDVDDLDLAAQRALQVLGDRRAGPGRPLLQAQAAGQPSFRAQLAGDEPVPLGQALVLPDEPHVSRHRRPLHQPGMAGNLEHDQPVMVDVDRRACHRRPLGRGGRVVPTRLVTVEPAHRLGRCEDDDVHPGLDHPRTESRQARGVLDVIERPDRLKLICLLQQAREPLFVNDTHRSPPRSARRRTAPQSRSSRHASWRYGHITYAR